MSEKILIVDDQEVMLRLLSLPLQSAGFTIITATDAGSALTKLRTERPDLIILDVMLPDASGIELCRQIRQTMQLHDLPIIILSGLTGLSTKIEGLEAGADEYVTKPIDPQEMVVRVRTMLSRTKRLRRSTPAQPQQGKIIAMIGVKGGVGTTTVPDNVAMVLSQRHQRVVAVELRPYFGAMAHHLQLSPEVNLGQIMEMTPRAINERQVGDHLIRIDERLRVLVGPQHLKEYRDMQPGQVEALLASLTQMADMTILDLPHMPSAATRNALRSSNLICIVLEPEPSSLASAQALLELLLAWGIERHSIRSIIVNRIQSTNVTHIDRIDQILQIEKAGVITSAPEQAVRAIATGQPLVRSAPDVLASTTLIELADLLATQLSRVPV